MKTNKWSLWILLVIATFAFSACGGEYDPSGEYYYEQGNNNEDLTTFADESETSVDDVVDYEDPTEFSYETDNIRRAAITSRNLSIANFNIQVFGKTKADKPAVMDVLAKTIAQFDIVSIQEIRDSSDYAIKKLEQAVDALGTDYSYIIGPRVGRTYSKEQYAFMYKTSSITPYTSFTYDDSASDIFQREPFMAKFKAKSSKFSFVLISIHTDPDDAEKEISALTNVVASAQTLFAPEKDYIILGDLNADCNYFDEDDTTNPLRGPDYLWLTTNDMDTTVATASCTYDRIIITNKYTKSDYAGVSGVFKFETLIGPTLLDPSRISDHYPIYATFYKSKDTN